MEHRLARLTKSPPVTRRAMVIWWTDGFHLHLLLGFEWPEGMRDQRFHPYSSAMVVSTGGQPCNGYRT
jgi:hypothetical protein